MNGNYSGRLSIVIAGVLPLVGVAALPSAVAAPTSSAAATEIATSLRLSPLQYKHTIADIFGDSIKIEGDFEPVQPVQGMQAIGERTSNITDSGLEAYDEIARGVTAQVVDPRHRAELIHCKPLSEMGRDDACARSFFARVGPLLYRRPLTEDEVQDRVQAAGMIADRLHDFYSGIHLSLAEMLISPEFLFRYKRMEPDPAHPGQERMDPYDKATELSYFLWDTTPDPQLLDAARSGSLNTRAGLDKQVNRLIGSPRVADAVRAFFSDMLGFSGFEAVSKDANSFPRYTPAIIAEAQEQTLRTIVDLVVNRHGDYRDLFTTPHTFLTRDMAALYGVPLVDTTDNGQPQRWLPYTYPPGDPRAGILSEASFTELWSPSGRSSATGRGKALQEQLLCKQIPPPPPNVSFFVVNDTTNPNLKTARARLAEHRANPVCAGCHRLMDPLGLALENFDSAGEYRTEENGAPIDATGELGGHKFYGPQGLSKAVYDDPAATNCVAQRAFAFETGYMPPTKDARWQQIQQKFVASHYDVLELLRAIAESDLSYSPPEPNALTAANR